jgi:hypothetical protein
VPAIIEKFLLGANKKLAEDLSVLREKLYNIS